MKLPSLRPSTVDNTKVTEAQIKYIESLLIDCEYTRGQRNGLLAVVTGRRVRYLDELTRKEASKVIEDLVDTRCIKKGVDNYERD